jgi:hypothetical protein
MGALSIKRHEKYCKNDGLSVSYNITKLRETNVCNSASLAMRHESNISLSPVSNQPLSGQSWLIPEEDVQSDTTCSQSAGHCIIGFVVCNAGGLP